MVATAALQSRELAVPASEELVQSMHEVIRSVLRRIHPTLEAEGISKGQFWTLHLVSSLPAASLSSVARHLSVSAPTACADIDQLEAAGLVTRHRSQKDRRAVDIALTPRGRRVEARVWNRMGEVMKEAMRGLPAGDVAAAVRVFRELTTRLEAPEVGGSP